MLLPALLSLVLQVYNKVGHGDFVVCWPTSVKTGGTGDSYDDDSYSHAADDDDTIAERGHQVPRGAVVGADESLVTPQRRRRQYRRVLRQLPTYNRDLCSIVSEAVQVDYVTSSGTQLQQGAAGAAVEAGGPEARSGVGVGVGTV